MQESRDRELGPFIGQVSTEATKSSLGVPPSAHSSSPDSLPTLGKS